MRNCFKQYSYWRYYLTRPWEFFDDTWLNLKAAWQRATKGFADRDTWNLNNYLLELLPEMVDLFRKNTHGYPGTNRFPTPEVWDYHLLNDIVIPLRDAQENQTTKKNEFEYIFEKYPLKIENHELMDDVPPELMKKWQKREEEIYRWRENRRLQGFSSLINEETFRSLWD